MDRGSLSEIRGLAILEIDDMRISECRQYEDIGISTMSYIRGWVKRDIRGSGDRDIGGSGDRDIKVFRVMFILKVVIFRSSNNAMWQYCGVKFLILYSQISSLLLLDLKYLKTLIREGFIATYPMGKVTIFKIFR